MGNKQPKSNKKDNSKNKKEDEDSDDEVEEEFFDDNITSKKKKNPSSLGLEHNPIISELKSDPFIDYTIIKKLGAGSFATVHLVKHKVSGTIRAMKAINKGNSEEDNELEIINEIKILMKMDHPTIVKIFEFYNQ